MTHANSKKTFTDHLRSIFKWILDPIGAFINSVGITPNIMTLLGLAGTMLGGYYLAQGNMLIGGIVILFMAPIDSLDGTMARLRGESTEFGAFVDSVSDRYSELIIIGGLLYYFTATNNDNGVMLAYLAAAGSILVSYVKARAEGLGFQAKVGLLTRVERYIVLIPCLIFNQPFAAMFIIAILANITALQRIFYVRKEMHRRMTENK